MIIIGVSEGTLISLAHTASSSVRDLPHDLGDLGDLGEKHKPTAEKQKRLAEDHKQSHESSGREARKER